MKRVNIKTQTIVGGAVPGFLKNLGTETLRNLQTALDSSQLEQLELVDIEFWPVQHVVVDLMPTQKAGHVTEVMDAELKQIISTTHAIEMTPEEIAESEESAKQELRERVVPEMIKRQSGGIIFSGIPISTDGNAIAQMSAAKQRQRAWRKIVPRFGRGRQLHLAEADFNSMFLAIENYQQAVQDWAYDLLVQIDEGEVPDINEGWPSNEL